MSIGAIIMNLFVTTCILYIVYKLYIIISRMFFPNSKINRKIAKQFNEYTNDMDQVINELSEKILITTLETIHDKKFNIIGIVTETSDHYIGIDDETAKKEVTTKVLLRAHKVGANAIIGLKTSSITEGGVVDGYGSIGARMIYTGTMVKYI